MGWKRTEWLMNSWTGFDNAALTGAADSTTGNGAAYHASDSRHSYTTFSQEADNGKDG